MEQAIQLLLSSTLQPYEDHFPFPVERTINLLKLSVINNLLSLPEISRNRDLDVVWVAL